ncbi:tyrosine-type recombinase/integrase [Microtetraspora fusca]|uniref:Tyrosine-type recombinase/integrase n=1 Tax=Microtetraspora fusca TaxID=1997 RepID=A0ABW6VA02_MICFU
METHLGLAPHQLRHSAATRFGEAKVPPLQLAHHGQTGHKNPRTAMRYTRPGSEAIAEV